MQLILFIGLQGAGKSTFYKQKFVDTHVRLNGDMLKTKNRQQILLNACLESKTATVIDKTNINQAQRKAVIEQAQANKFEVIAYYFDVTLADALSRNNQRVGKSKVPEIGVRGTYKQLEKPHFGEGFNKIYYVSVVDTEFVVHTVDDTQEEIINDEI